jgi:hypothetical protein
MVRLFALALFAAAPMAPAQTLAPALDQTEDVAVVAQFLAKLKAGDHKGGTALLSATVSIEDTSSGRPRTLADLADYASRCPLAQVLAVPIHHDRGRRPMPLGATWRCRYPEKDRSANFWTDAGKIRRITFGEPIIIEVPAMAPRKGAN